MLNFVRFILIKEVLMEPQSMFNRMRALRKIGTLLSLVFLPMITAGQSNFEVQVEMMITRLDSPPDTSGLATISYDPGVKDSYLSLGIQDFNGSAFNIVVSNCFLPSKHYSDIRQSISVPFDPELMAPTAASFPSKLIAYVHQFDQPADYPFEPSTHKDTEVLSVRYSINDARGLAVSYAPPAPPPPTPPPGTRAGDAVSEVIYRGSTMPNIDLSGELHPATDVYAGDVNACAPTSTANSLLWMDKQFGIFKKLAPAGHDLVDSLSRYMRRPRGDGPSTESMIRGKLDFIDAKNLPLAVRFQVEGSTINTDIISTKGNTSARCSNSSSYPTWDFLKQAMKESCDVEINYEAIDAFGKRYAHSVVVTGVEEYKREGLRYLSYSHDLSQSVEGGTRQEAVQVWQDPDGRLRISGAKNAFIRDVVAECPSAPYSSVALDGQPGGPSGFELLSNYPNPFNSSTVVAFRLTESVEVTMVIRDSRGRIAAVRELGRLPAGENRTVWLARDEPSGVYVLSLRAGSRILSRKIALIR
jgi:hypothetical protein